MVEILRSRFIGDGTGRISSDELLSTIAISDDFSLCFLNMDLSLWEGAGDAVVVSVDRTELVRDGGLTLSFRRDQNGMSVWDLRSKERVGGVWWRLLKTGDGAIAIYNRDRWESVTLMVTWWLASFASYDEHLRFF